MPGILNGLTLSERVPMILPPGLWSDVCDAMRRLRRKPWFTATIVATLAIGIGMCAAVFTVVKVTLFDGFPLVKDGNRVVYITTTDGTVYFPDYEQWRATSTTFSDIALMRNVYVTLRTSDGDIDTNFATEVTANTFDLLGVRPFLGRDFLPEDQQPGAQPVAILRYDVWRRRFAADASVVGRFVSLNGVATTIIGVMPQRFSFPTDQALWIPLRPTEAALRREMPYARYAVGRLVDGATLESANAELTTIGNRLAAIYAATNRNLKPVLQTFAEWSAGSQGTLLYWAAFGAVLFVLLVVCASTAHLLLVDTVSRTRDVAIRLATGATPARAIRPLFVEAFMVSTLGGIVGWCIAEICLRAYALAQPERDYTRILSYTMDLNALGFLTAASIGTSVLVGLAAATGLARVDMTQALRDAPRGASRRGGRLTNWLVSLQMALAVVLLAGSGVTIRSILNVVNGDVGVHGDNVLSMSLYVPPDQYTGAVAQASFFNNVRDGLAAIPGVESAGIGAAAPAEYVPSSAYELVDTSLVSGPRPSVARFVADEGYFGTLGIRVLAGRGFDGSDRPSSVPVAIVNESFASAQWPSESAIGKRLRFFSGDQDGPWLTVVGVVANVVQNDRRRRSVSPIIYVPFSQSPQANMFAFARTSVPPTALTDGFRRVVYALDPGLPVPALWSLDERLQRNYSLDRRVTGLFSAFAAAALFLASFGLYASVSRAISARTQEIGVRAALGATARDIGYFVLTKAAVPVSIGLAIGLTASLGVNHAIGAVLVDVSPADPLTLALASVILLAASTIGCMIPARRAILVDPAVALRHG